MTHSLTFTCESLDDAGGIERHELTVAPGRLVIAGWTGRDAVAIEHHIEELAALGVPRPSSVPLYYRVGAALLTQSATIEVLGGDSSGEVEPVLFFASGEWWLTVGSDHTDRRVETYSVAVSKQLCPKPVATTAWRWRDVAGRQDGLGLCSRILEDGRWVDYQSGGLHAIRPLESLRDGIFPPGEGGAAPGHFITCGTLAARPDARGVGIRPAAAMELELHDPVLDRRIVHRYAAQPLDIVS